MAATERRIAEANQHMSTGDKHLKTGLFKWKPDYDSAASEYSKAATAFRNAKATDKAVDAHMKAAECYNQNGQGFQSAKSLEAAATILKEEEKYPRAISLIEAAANQYLEHGTPDTAAISLDRAAKMIDRINPDKSVELYMRGADICEADGKTRQCAELVGRAGRLLVRTKKYGDALSTLKKETDLLLEVDNHGAINKLVAAVVLIHLHQEDWVAADRALKSASSYPGFCASEEADGLERLLTCYDQGDQQGAAEAVRAPVFRYMENDFAKLARDLRLPGGAGGAAPGAAGDDDDLASLR